jgi:hypothetical protein
LTIVIISPFAKDIWFGACATKLKAAKPLICKNESRAPRKTTKIQRYAWDCTQEIDFQLAWRAFGGPIFGTMELCLLARIFGTIVLGWLLWNTRPVEEQEERKLS